MHHIPWNTSVPWKILGVPGVLKVLGVVEVGRDLGSSRWFLGSQGVLGVLGVPEGLGESPDQVLLFHHALENDLEIKAT